MLNDCRTGQGEAASKAVGRVSLLDIDPDLAIGITASQVPAATQRSLVATFSAAAGHWKPRALGASSALYLISGAMARRVVVGGRSTVEILGSGDVFRAERAPTAAAVSGAVTWKPLSPVWFAVLDPEFWTRMGPFPSVTVALLDRTQDRARSLSMRMAMNGDPNLATRLMLLLWHLADTHGRVTPSGVLIDLRLSHETLSSLVSARRPSVSASLKRLQLAGELSPGREGGLLLLGEPPVTGSTHGVDTQAHEV